MKNGISSLAFATFLFLVSNSIVLSQVDTLWTKYFGGVNEDIGRSVRQTTDGGYIITGYTLVSGSNYSDVWLIKTDPSGNILWTKTFGGSFDDEGYSVRQTTDGGYVIVGIKAYNSEDDDVWLIKTDATGNALWNRLFGGSEYDAGSSVEQTSDGGYIITGVTYSSGAGMADVWLIKTDTQGNMLWSKSFGGNSFEGGIEVQHTTDGGYIIAGLTQSYGAGSYDAWLIKTDSSGNTHWTKTFGGTYYDAASSVQQSTDGGYILVGSKSSSAGNSDVWLIKTDSLGNSLWSKTFGGIDSDGGKSVQQPVDGGYIIVGSTWSFGAGMADVWLIKTDNFGDTLWTKTFGGSVRDFGNYVQQTTDEGYIITGYSEAPGGYADILLIKTTPEVTNVETNTDLIISDFSLYQNYPNPFNPSTKISWQVPVGSWQSLKIYDVLGNEVTTLINEYKPAGIYEVEFNATSHSGNVRNLTNGVYFYQLRAGSFVETKKMVLLR